MKFIHSLLVAVLAPVLVAAPFPQPGSSEAPAAASSLTVHAVSTQAGVDVQVTDEAGTPVRDAAVIVRLPDDAPTGTFANGSHAQVAYTDADGHAHVTNIQWTAGQGTVPVQVTVTKGESHAGTIVEQVLGSPTVPQTPRPSLAHVEAKTPVAPTLHPASPAIVTASAPATPPPATPVSQAPSLTPAGAAANSEIPRVSVISHPTDQKISSGGHKKWIILALAVGAGVGAAFVLGGKKSSSSSTSSSTSGTTIGSPTVSVGQP